LEELESFFEVVIVFFAMIGALLSMVKKSQRNRVKEAARQPSPAAWAETARKPAKPVLQPAQSPPAAFPGMSFGDVPSQVMTPTVHVHLEPDCETHDAPGSLDYTSTEGKDPCHEEQLNHVRTPEAAPVHEGGLTFDWTGDNMVKAIVMQEVLTRPVQRRAR